MTKSSTPDFRAPVSVTVSAVGDILIHAPVAANAKKFAAQSGKSGFDFDPMFRNVKSVVSQADLAICNMETPLASSDENLSRPGSLVFNAPKQIAPALKNAGFDGCSTASNHTWDQGIAGVKSTRNQLQAAGLKVAGPTASDTPMSAAMYEAKGVKIANLGYTYTIFNSASPNTQVPPSAPWLKQYLWPAVGAAGVLADAKKAKDAGAELVVLSMHWGTEYQQLPTADQKRLARELLASPYVDAIVGHHAHVVQPCDTIGGETVFYGVGNFLSNQHPSQHPILKPINNDGVIVSITFERDASGKWTQQSKFQPTRVDLPQGHVVQLSKQGDGTNSFERTKQIELSGGSCQATAVTSGG